MEIKAISKKCENGSNGSIPDGNHPLNQMNQNSNHLNQMNQMNNEPTKNRILLSLKESNKSIKDISKILDSNIRTISYAIKRDERNSGLLYEELVEIKEIKNNVEYWGLTLKGIEKVKSLINELETKEAELKESEERNNEIKTKINDFELCLYEEYFDEIQDNKSKIIEIDIEKIRRYNIYLEEELYNNFEETLKIIKISCQRIEPNFNKEIRIKNPHNSQYKNIFALAHEHFDKLITLEGMVKGRSDRRPQIISSKFECPSCGNIIPLLQLEKKFKQPSKCGCGRRGKFTRLQNELITIQRLEVEEFSENLKGINEPRQIPIILKNELCSPENQSDFNPGMRVKFIGMLKAEMQTEKTLLDIYFEVNNYEVLEQRLDKNLTSKDEAAIKELNNKNNCKEILINSFSPDTICQDKAKLGLLLSLVKGEKIPGIIKRERIHILLVSNPGTSKSEMGLEFCELAPLSRYANGTSSSNVGLTASVVKDELVGGWRLNAGAVALANNGYCIVDEFDKFRDEDKKDLNSCMEQGIISISKATIQQKLLANTTIIGLCNPKDERFNEGDTYLKQINLPKSLIDRFDLIFCTNNSSEVFDNILMDKTEKENISKDLLSKFMIYASKIKVDVSMNIKKLIQDKFKVLMSDYNNSFELGVRQIHSLVRLSTAFAKLNLRSEVKEKDVEDAFTLYVDSLRSLHIYN